MTRAEILDEFGSAACENECEAGDCISERKMADEIVRLRSILDKLREPSPKMRDAVMSALNNRAVTDPIIGEDIDEIIEAAVAAAERETLDETTHV